MALDGPNPFGGPFCGSHVVKIAGMRPLDKRDAAAQNAEMRPQGLEILLALAVGWD